MASKATDAHGHDAHGHDAHGDAHDNHAHGEGPHVKVVVVPANSPEDSLLRIIGLVSFAALIGIIGLWRMAVTAVPVDAHTPTGHHGEFGGHSPAGNELNPHGHPTETPGAPVENLDHSQPGVTEQPAPGAPTTPPADEPTSAGEATLDGSDPPAKPGADNTPPSTVATPGGPVETVKPDQTVETVKPDQTVETTAPLNNTSGPPKPAQAPAAHH